MEEPKKLVYDSGAQPEEVFLRVSGYLDRNRLYVGIYQTEYGYPRSEEHTSELQSRGIISYADFCLKKKKKKKKNKKTKKK